MIKITEICERLVKITLDRESYTHPKRALHSLNCICKDINVASPYITVNWTVYLRCERLYLLLFDKYLKALSALHILFLKASRFLSEPEVTNKIWKTSLKFA